MENEIVEYEINNGPYKLKALNVGCAITEYSINGHNIVLAYEDLKSYETNSALFGAIIGRTAGRTKNDVKRGWKLPCNYLNEHNIHGNELHKKYFEVTKETNTLVFEYFDKEDDYPGNAKITVKYHLTLDGLEVEVFAESDKETLFNFTNHTYFNLGSDTILNHSLQIDSEKYCELDEQMFSQSDKDVQGTAFDFKEKKLIQESMNQGDEQFEITKFIDHPFKLEGSINYSNEKYSLEISSSLDYVVIYCGNYLGGEKDKFLNHDCVDYSGICFETQHKPGRAKSAQNYYSKTKYKLSQNGV